MMINNSNMSDFFFFKYIKRLQFSHKASKHDQNLFKLPAVNQAIVASSKADIQHFYKNHLTSLKTFLF